MTFEPLATDCNDIMFANFCPSFLSVSLCHLERIIDHVGFLKIENTLLMGKCFYLSMHILCKPGKGKIECKLAYVDISRL